MTYRKYGRLDTCFERPEKYMEEVLRPIVEFRRYKVADSAAVRESRHQGGQGSWEASPPDQRPDDSQYHGQDALHRLEGVGHQKTRVDAGELGSAFEEFVQRKWQDALNIAAEDPQPWGTEREKSNPGKGAVDKTAHGDKGAPRISEAVNMVGQQSPPQIALAIMGCIKWKEVSGTVSGRVRWGSCAPSVCQVTRTEPGQKKGGAEAEWVVPVLPEACSRGRVLQARRVLKAKVYADRMQWRARG